MYYLTAIQNFSHFEINIYRDDPRGQLAGYIKVSRMLTLVTGHLDPARITLNVVLGAMSPQEAESLIEWQRIAVIIAGKLDHIEGDPEQAIKEVARYFARIDPERFTVIE